MFQWLSCSNKHTVEKRRENHKAAIADSNNIVGLLQYYVGLDQRTLWVQMWVEEYNYNKSWINVSNSNVSNVLSITGTIFFILSAPVCRGKPLCIALYYRKIFTTSLTSNHVTCQVHNCHLILTSYNNQL